MVFMQQDLAYLVILQLQVADLIDEKAFEGRMEERDGL